MTKKISWRLKTLPTTDELQSLVKDGILTKEEAREILFSQEEVEQRDVKSLEAEIKFLRELVAKLSENRTRIVETVEKVYVPYKNQDWYRPYQIWCGAGGTTTTISNGIGVSGNYTLTSGASGTGNAMYLAGATGDFDTIKTF